MILYYAMKNGEHVTYSIAPGLVPLENFQTYGTLDNQWLPSTGFIGVLTTAISRDLGTIQATQDLIVWAVGLVTNPVINYNDPFGAPPQQRSLYYETHYNDKIVDFAALLAMGTIAFRLVVWHRHTRGHTSVGSSSLRSHRPGHAGHNDAIHNAVGTRRAIAEAAPLAAGSAHRPSSPEDSPLPLRRVVSFSVGLSGRELARLRSNGSRSQPMDGRPFNPPLTVTTGRGAPEGAAATATASSEAGSLRLANNFLGRDLNRRLVMPVVGTGSGSFHRPRTH